MRDWLICFSGGEEGNGTELSLKTILVTVNTLLHLLTDENMIKPGLAIGLLSLGLEQIR